VAGGLTAFKGPLQGALEGKLGIQQPGWHPGMPVTGSGDTTGGSGGFNLPMPFGLPNIEVPQAPPGPQEHPGSGAAPGPTVVQNNDRTWTWTSPHGLQHTTEPHDYRLGP